MPRTPIFLFSLPRSGSTLLQRIMGAHPQITSAAEPWILLPILQALHRNSAVAEHGHQIQHDAMRDFVGQIPHGEAIWNTAVRKFALTLYEGVDPSQSTRYFLDKTPRYSLVCDAVVDAFPDAKFVLLVRNPLAVASSIFSTWNKRYWNPAKHNCDFYTGMRRLVETYERDRNSILKVRYEDLVGAPEKEVARICDFLDLACDPSMLRDFASVQFDGRMGDPTGIHKYSRISDESVGSWQEHCRGFVRKAWLRRWIDWIGQERLQILGYDWHELREEIDALPRFYPGVVRDFISGLVWTSALAVQAIILKGRFGSEPNALRKPWI